MQPLIGVGLGALVGMGLYFFGFYGGADGKALIVLGLLVPHFVPQVGLYSVAPLIILTNGVLISILLPLGLLIYNVSMVLRRKPIFDGFDEPLYRKVLASLLGYRQSGKIEISSFRWKKTVPGPGPGNEIKKFDFSLMRDDFETKGDTWVTPGIPLLVFFTAGYFFLLFYGDLVNGLIGVVSKRFRILVVEMSGKSTTELNVPSLSLRSAVSSSSQ